MKSFDEVDISDNLEIIKAKKALIVRVGGLGDCLILTAVAKQLHKRGYVVDIFVGSPTGEIASLFIDLPYVNQVKAVSRLNGVDSIKDENENWIAVAVLKDGYDEVFDFKNSVEDNRSGFNGDKGWRRTINSNYINWVDLSLAWAGIDWTKVSNEEKRPDITIHEKCINWVINESLIGNKETRDFRVIGIQLQASSLVRTWYRAGDLPEMIHAKYPNDVVLIFATNQWVALSKFGKVKLDIPEEFNLIVCSAALIQQMDIFIGADTGMTHIAEAVETASIAIYTTVPSWTRTKYYRYVHPIDATVKCAPCFVLDVFCPLEREVAKNALSERERLILTAGDNNEDIYKISKEFQTVPKAVMDEYTAIKQKLEATSAKMPACVGSITSEMIMNKLQELLGE